MYWIYYFSKSCIMKRFCWNLTFDKSLHSGFTVSQVLADVELWWEEWALVFSIKFIYKINTKRDLELEQRQVKASLF